jgi:hypothetical protein
MPHQTSFIIFMGVTALVGLAGVAFMHVSRNVAFTRRHLLSYVSKPGASRASSIGAGIHARVCEVP